MTMTPEQNPANEPAKTPEHSELEALRAHNTQLLTELKEAKRKAGELASQMETVTIDRDEATAAVKRLTIEPVVNAALEASMALPPHMVRPLLEHQYGYTFDLQDGKVVMFKAGELVYDGHGKPVEITKDGLQAHFGNESQETPDFRHLLRASGASGSGAGQSTGDFGITNWRKEPATRAPTPLQQFGIK